MEALRKTFESYLASFSQDERDAMDMLQVLVNSLTFEVYVYIEECVDYDEAMATLQTIFVKTSNEMFAPHKLATARQQPGQSLDEFLQQLRKLSKHCNFAAVNVKK